MSFNSNGDLGSEAARMSQEGAWLGPTVDCVAAFSGQCQALESVLHESSPMMSLHPNSRPVDRS